MRRSSEVASTPEVAEVRDIRDAQEVMDALQAAGLVESCQDIAALYQFATDGGVVEAHTAWWTLKALRADHIFDTDDEQAGTPQLLAAQKAGHVFMSLLRTHHERATEEGVGKAHAIIQRHPGLFLDPIDEQNAITGVTVGHSAEGQWYFEWQFADGNHSGGSIGDFMIDSARLSAEEKQAVDAYSLHNKTV
jgi:hypothetical protein